MRQIVIVVIIQLGFIGTFYAQFNPSEWGDLGNKQFRNPVLPADYPDPDVIRVGNDYYMISSTFQLSPGIVILHSHDLVNWETMGYVIDDLPSQLKDNRFNYDVMDHYNNGVYAPSIRFHDNKFWVYFSTYNKGGFYLATAEDIKGPWRIELMKDKNGKDLFGLDWDDPCPVWDEDGNAFLVASKPGRFWFPILFQMSDDGTQLLDATIEKMKEDTLSISDRGTNILPYALWGEGNKILKMNDYYYIFHNQLIPYTYGRDARISRSKNLFGTKADGTPGKPGDPGIYDFSPQFSPSYVMVHGDSTGNRFDQGAIVDDPTGENWYFVTHQGQGYANGRPVSVLPINWIDGWPMAGVDHDKDRVGEPVWVADKPVDGEPKSFPQGNDEFNSENLDLKWQWNYQPRSDKWSLTDHQGFLRLYAFKPIEEGEFFKAGNTICQRYVYSDSVNVEIKMEINKMANGQKAGLVHFNGGVNYCYLGIVKEGATKRIVFNNNGEILLGSNINSSTIWFKTITDKNAVSTFYYSENGKEYIQFGTNYQGIFGGFRGDHIGIFNFNDKQEKGYVDVDWFHYEFSEGINSKMLDF